MAEEYLSDLELRQQQVDGLMVWLGWNNAPYARDLNIQGKVDMQKPIREMSQLGEKVKEAKAVINNKEENNITIPLFPVFSKGGVRIISKTGRIISKTESIRIGDQIVPPATRELFQRAAEVLVREFGFTVPEKISPGNVYPTNDPEVFVSVGKLSDQLKNKPLKDVSLVIGRDV